MLSSHHHLSLSLTSKPMQTTPSKDQRLSLWSDHIPLANKLVNEHCFRSDLREDALQEAKLALWEASDAWSEGMQETFTHYAWLVMRRKLLTYLTEKATERPKLSHSDREVMKALKEHLGAGKMITSKLIESLSNESGVSSFRITQVISYWYFSSMRITASSFSLMTEPVAEDAPSGLEDADCLMKSLDEAMADLPDRDRQIVHARFLSDPIQTLRELAKTYGVSIERIRQIEQRAIKKLRSSLSSFETI